MTAPRTGSWWRRNRWGLVALPLALTAALGASSDRVATYYWNAGLHQAQGADQGEWLSFTTTYVDANGTHGRELDLRLDATRDLPGVATGTGTRLVEVTLSFRADPALPLTGCRLALRDARGTRYEAIHDIVGPDALPRFSCVPAETPGPGPSLGAIDTTLGDDDSPPRPREWTVTGSVLLPADVEVTEALVWWQEPDYARLAFD